MAMGGGSGRGGGDLNSEINVTPLVDVMLVLLVIFMVTAPMLTTGVDIDLPQTDAPAVKAPEGALTLSIQQGNHVFLSGKPLKWADLRGELERDPRLAKTKELQVEADKDLPYSVVVTAMAVARQAGAVKLQMVTDPNAQLDLAELDATTGAPASPGGAAGGAR